MRHLTEEELLDLAEGTRPEAAAGHLAACAECQVLVTDMRSALTLATTVLEVPEPSPLFWDHLSARVRESIEAGEPTPGVGWRPGWMTWQSVAALGAVALLVALMFRPAHEPVTIAKTETPVDAVEMSAEAEALVSLADDPSLTLLADLTADLDWDAANEAGLAPSAGTVDDVVASLNSAERLELHRLLREALTPPGA